MDSNRAPVEDERTPPQIAIACAFASALALANAPHSRIPRKYRTPPTIPQDSKLLTPPPTASRPIALLVAADSTKASFADLPPEIRNEIYSYVAASFPYSITFTGPHRKRTPFYDIHPQIRHEFGSLFFAIPRTYVFSGYAYNSLRMNRAGALRERSLAIRRADAFFESAAFRRVMATKTSKIELVLNFSGRGHGKLTNDQAVKLAAKITRLANDWMSTQYARLEGGAGTTQDSRNALKELYKKMALLCNTPKDNFDIIGNLLCAALPRMVSECLFRPDKIYLDIAIVFKEIMLYGVTVQGRSEREK
ncbi:uncharacterized protein BDZ99DRAFT_565451 [Mytilinidion resinicola]|uniref:Uncharacterized protein n=1 Tax=Mytilinidion resinicola TaxID=574789 RepID=A0A6A6Z9P2_9PEZI|nr:uncharacterized protein BDZ99DRAFT_565451 [Mytilinidion resinicola]KAF2817750.1 hypothetical protein BDZ99DRAFT_565451 [Mytilinidion resinicola]